MLLFFTTMTDSNSSTQSALGNPKALKNIRASAAVAVCAVVGLLVAFPQSAEAQVMPDSVSITDNRLKIRYNVALKEDSKPAPSAYTVTNDDNTVTVTSVAISDRTVTLTLENDVPGGDNVKVSYSVPADTDKQVQDTAGNKAEALVERDVDDRTRPRFLMAVADRSTVTVTYDEPLNESSEPDADAYKVEEKGSGDFVGVIEDLFIKGETVTLILREPVPEGASLTLDYNRKGSELLDVSRRSDNRVSSFNTKPDIKNITDNTPPTLDRVTLSNDKLRLVYDEELDTDSRPAVGAYTVTATPEGGSSRPIQVTDVSITGNTVTLTLMEEIPGDETVTLSYTMPDSAPRVQDPSGNLAVSFLASDHEVTNSPNLLMKLKVFLEGAQ